MKFDVNKEVKSRLNLKPDKDKYWGLVLAELEEVKVADSEVAMIDDKGSESKSEFKGHKVPRISLTWKNHKVSTDEEDRYYTLSYGMVPTVTKEGTPISDKTMTSIYTTMFDNLKHNLDCYEKMPNYKPLISIPDIDEHGTVEARIKQTKAFFEAFAAAFNNGENPIYKDAFGNSVPVFLKLVADYSTGTKYSTPTFVQQGYVEIAVKDVKSANGWKKPLIELKPNDSIDLQAKGKKTASNVNINTGQSDLDPALQAILDQHK